MKKPGRGSEQNIRGWGEEMKYRETKYDGQSRNTKLVSQKGK